MPSVILRNKTEVLTFFTAISATAVLPHNTMVYLEKRVQTPEESKRSRDRGINGRGNICRLMVATAMGKGESAGINVLPEVQETRLVVSCEPPRLFESIAENDALPNKKACAAFDLV